MIFKKLIKNFYIICIKTFSGSGLKKYFIIRKIDKIFKYFIKKKMIKIYGNVMFLDSEDSLNLSLGEIHDKEEFKIIKKIIKKGDNILDIGANIGYYTLFLAKLVGKNGKIFAFEPDPTNFKILTKNVNRNGYKNIKLENKAVSDKSEKIKLYLCEDNTGMHRIFKSKYCNNSIDVLSIKLDEFFKNNPIKINFIKIDIEGAEISAIRGMASLIKRSKKLIMLTEFAPYAINEFGSSPKKYLELLIENGFELYDLNSGKIKKIKIPELLKKYTVKKNNMTNLICIKGEDLFK